MEYVASQRRNPFDMTPPCDRYVPGYGDTNANFHVVGDHPGVHGGLEVGIPFTGRPWSTRFFTVLEEAGLVETERRDGTELSTLRTFLSYLHMCVPDGTPTETAYARLEPFFDAELRAITAHVLLPVGARPTAHVLRTYTARSVDGDVDMEAVHAEEIHGSGWLVVPAKDPTEWTDGDGRAVRNTLVELQRTDYRQISDLGRFIPGDDPYLVR